MLNVQVRISRTIDGWSSSDSLPSFQLDGDLLGIVSEDHAISIVKRIVDPFGDLEENGAEIHITVAKL